MWRAEVSGTVPSSDMTPRTIPPSAHDPASVSVPDARRAARARQATMIEAAMTGARTPRISVAARDIQNGLIIQQGDLLLTAETIQTRAGEVWLTLRGGQTVRHLRLRPEDLLCVWN